MKLYSFYGILEIAGTFAFAISGATAARQRRLDLFGIFAIAFLVACGGGIIRDLCIGAIPPAGLTTWYYLVAALAAAVLTVGFYPLVERLKHPVLLFDAAGLSLFAVTGTQKALSYESNAQLAVLLGITTGVGGGVLRDVLLNRVPVILQKEIYAFAAFIASLVVVLGSYFSTISADLISIVAIAICFSLRMLALHLHWNMPVPRLNPDKES